MKVQLLYGRDGLEVEVPERATVVRPRFVEAAPDTVRECANECVFCFIDGNPDHARESLGLRDDDFRLSAGSPRRAGPSTG